MQKRSNSPPWGSGRTLQKFGVVSQYELWRKFSSRMQFSKMEFPRVVFNLGDDLVSLRKENYLEHGLISFEFFTTASIKFKGIVDCRTQNPTQISSIITKGDNCGMWQNRYLVVGRWFKAKVRFIANRWKYFQNWSNSIVLEFFCRFFCVVDSLSKRSATSNS